MAWGYPSQLATEQNLIEAFHQLNPDVYVTFIMVPIRSYYDKLGIMFASGTAPDVIRVNGVHFPLYAANRYLARLDGLMEADPNYNGDDFFPPARDAGLLGDEHYGLGVLLTRSLVYYNKTLFEEAGVETPWESYLAGRWQWEDFLDAAKKLTRFDEKTGRPIQFGTNSGTAYYGVFDRTLANGGNALSADGKQSLVNSPEAVEALRLIDDLSRKWHVSPTPQQGAMSLFSFESGKMAMEFDSSGESPRFRDAIKDFEWDVAPIPLGTAGPYASHGAHLLVMNAATRQQEAAWRFMTFVTGPVAERLLGVELRRCIPGRRAIALSQEYLSADLPPFNMRAFVADIDAPIRRVRVTEKFSEWTTVYQSHLDQVFLGDRDAQEAMDDAAERINKILEER